MEMSRRYWDGSHLGGGEEVKYVMIAIQIILDAYFLFAIFHMGGEIDDLKIRKAYLDALDGLGGVYLRHSDRNTPRA